MAKAQAAPTALDEKIGELFMASVDMAGGLQAMVERRRLDWLPGLMESAYVVVLKDEEQRSADDIMQASGLSSGAVSAILDAPIEGAAQKLDEQAPLDQIARDHIAGGIAKSLRQAGATPP